MTARYDFEVGLFGVRKLRNENEELVWEIELLEGQVWLVTLRASLTEHCVRRVAKALLGIGT